MTEPSLALQTAIRNRLIASATVTALVPATAILDQHMHPKGERLILLGTGTTLFADHYESFTDQAALDVHIWTREDSFRDCKEIAGAAREALRDAPWPALPYVVQGVSINARYIRDPDGEYCHAVLSVDATMQVAA